MEKSRIEDPLNFRSMYTGFKQQAGTVPRIIDSVGFGFTAGTMGGFGYHLIKGGWQQRSVLAGMKAAGANATRFAGLCVLLELGVQIPASAMYSVCNDRYKPMVYHAAHACCGALVTANKGLRVASSTALFFTGVSLFFEGLGVWLHKFAAPPICKTNTYTYPHYLPPQQTQELPTDEAPQD